MTPRHALAPAYLAVCLLLGGASAAGYMANMLLQLAAVPLIYASFAFRRETPLSPPARQLLILALLLVTLFIVQLIPLPPEIWTQLPGRQPVAEGFALLDLPLPWMSLSLAPQQTIWSLVWFLPAFATLLAIVKLGAFRPNWIAWTLVVLTTLAVAVGALQVAGGARAAAYFYEVTNRGFAVGFFSNSNHMATLLLVTIPFLAALQATVLGKTRRSVRRSSGLVVLTAGFMGVVAVGLVINTSIAGLGLAVPTAAASFLLVRARRKAIPVWAFPAIGILAAVAVAVVLTAPLGNNLTSDDARQSVESRYTSFSRTADAAAEYFPAGSGIGTFVDVYRTHESPGEVYNVYMNHAHSDFLEVLLETGLLGMVLLALFLLWWIRRVVAIWRALEPDLFARAATIASAAVLAHSCVDYPLRTAAISALFAAFLAVMAEPRPQASRRDQLEEDARHLSAETL